MLKFEIFSVKNGVQDYPFEMLVAGNFVQKDFNHGGRGIPNPNLEKLNQRYANLGLQNILKTFRIDISEMNGYEDKPFERFISSFFA